MNLTWDLGFSRYDTKFSYRLWRRPGPELVVFFPGLRRKGSRLDPFYNRMNWVADYVCSCLFVSDPGLKAEPEVRGTWHQGSAAYYAVERAAADIAAISGEFKFDREKTILYGSSQGGFTAMGVGAYLKGARVLAECPQTDLRQFNLVSDLGAMAQRCYGVQSVSEIAPEFAYRLDLAELYAKARTKPTGRIIVRASDIHHVDVHLAHFEKRHSGVFVPDVWDDRYEPHGHVPIPQSRISEMINRMLAE